jgi:branched-chain amino acid transport system substrate-binding protein
MRSITRRTFTTATLAAVAAPALIQAAEKPLRIGFSIAQTGNIASGGRAGLAALQMWREDVNAAGGLLGRTVEFVVYDDQSNPGLVPGIYAKLIDLDRVDLLLLPYATNPSAVVMPMIT